MRLRVKGFGLGFKFNSTRSRRDSFGLAGQGSR